MSVEPEQLVGISKKVLKLLGVDDGSDIKITYAEKVLSTWKVNFSYSTDIGLTRNIACYKIDSTGNIMGMWLDRRWK